MPGAAASLPPPCCAALNPKAINAKTLKALTPKLPNPPLLLPPPMPCAAASLPPPCCAACSMPWPPGASAAQPPPQQGSAQALQGSGFSRAGTRVWGLQQTGSGGADRASMVVAFTVGAGCSPFRVKSMLCLLQCCVIVTLQRRTLNPKRPRPLPRSPSPACCSLKQISCKLSSSSSNATLDCRHCCPFQSINSMFNIVINLCSQLAHMSCDLCCLL